MPEKFANLKGTRADLNWGLAILQELSKEFGDKELEDRTTNALSTNPPHWQYVEDTFNDLKWHWGWTVKGTDPWPECPICDFSLTFSGISLLPAELGAFHCESCGFRGQAGRLEQILDKIKEQIERKATDYWGYKPSRKKGRQANNRGTE